MSAMTVAGPKQVDVGAIDKEFEAIWKTLAPPSADDVRPVMQASVVNLVAVCNGEAEADVIAETMLGMVDKTPCRFIILDSRPEADPPDISAYVSVACVKSGDRQICCELIRVTATGISADSLPTAVEAFYAPDLPVVLWWSAALTRPDLPQFAASADRVIIDTLDFGAAGMRYVSDRIGESRKTRTALSDLNWMRLTPYRQLFAQFFDLPERRNFLSRIESVTIEAQEAAGMMLTGWLLSRLDRDPFVIQRDQIKSNVVESTGPVFHSLVMKCKGAEFSLTRKDDACVVAASKIDGEAASRVVRVPLASVEALLEDEVTRTGRDRAYDVAVRAGIGA